MAEKMAKTKQPEKTEKPKVAQAQKAKAPEKDKPKSENRFQRWWRETLGELRKVSWPTIPEARRLTGIVLAVMFGMAIVLGTLDWVFSRLIALMVH